MRPQVARQVIGSGKAKEFSIDTVAIACSRTIAISEQRIRTFHIHDRRGSRYEVLPMDARVWLVLRAGPEAARSARLSPD